MPPMPSLNDLRAKFLEEFDALADYVSPVQDLSPSPNPEPGEEAA